MTAGYTATMKTTTAAAPPCQPVSSPEPDLDFFVQGVLPLAGDAVAIVGARVTGRVVVMDRAGRSLHASDAVVLDSLHVCAEGVLHYTERPHIPSRWGGLPAAERYVRFDPRI